MTVGHSSDCCLCREERDQMIAAVKKLRDTWESGDLAGATTEIIALARTLDDTFDDAPEGT